jgi:hypothetical protein
MKAEALLPKHFFLQNFYKSQHRHFNHEAQNWPLLPYSNMMTDERHLPATHPEERDFQLLDKSGLPGEFYLLIACAQYGAGSAGLGVLGL